jgi:endonuclease/exonuclease/phosphatase (EEP) superfamily protein YafD
MNAARDFVDITYVCCPAADSSPAQRDLSDQLDPRGARCIPSVDPEPGWLNFLEAIFFKMLRKLRRFFGFVAAVVFWMIASGAVVLLVYSYLLPQDLALTTEPYARMVQIAFFGRVFTFHLGLTLAVIAAIAGCIGRMRLTVVSAVPALVVLIPAMINCLPKHPTPAVGPTVRIMSANLKYFNRDAERIINQIRQNDPQVLVIQDYTPFSQDVIDSEFAHDYAYRQLVPNFGQGLAIYSRLPFEDGPPKTMFDKSHRQMRAVIRINNQPVALYVVHPFSPRTGKRILSNRLETLELVKQVQAEKIPSIMAGDFNFTAETPNESAIKSIGMKDAFELAGMGRGSTWPVNPTWLQWLPGVRIDHVFVSPQLTCTAFTVGGFDGSDHLPIIAEVGIAVK